MYDGLKRAFQGVAKGLHTPEGVTPNTTVYKKNKNIGDDPIYRYYMLVYNEVSEALRKDTQTDQRKHNSGSVTEQDIASLKAFILDYNKVISRAPLDKRVQYTANTLYSFLYNLENGTQLKTLTSGEKVYLRSPFIGVLSKMFSDNILEAYRNNENGVEAIKSHLEKVTIATFNKAERVERADITQIVDQSKGLALQLEEDRMAHYLKSCYTQLVHHRNTTTVTSLETLKGIGVDESGIAFFELFITDYLRRTQGRSKEYKVEYLRVAGQDLAKEVYKTTRTIEAYSQNSDSTKWHKEYLKEIKARVSIISAVFDCRFVSNFNDNIHDMEAMEKYARRTLEIKYNSICRESI